MQRPITLLLILFLLVLTGTPCQPTRTRPSSSTLVGKLVVSGPCGFYVVQVLSGDIDSTRIQKTWEYKFSKTDTVFTNVFRVSDICSFNGYGVGLNHTFSFEFTDSTLVENCMNCLIAWPSAPNVANTVDHVQVLPQ